MKAIATIFLTVALQIVGLIVAINNSGLGWTLFTIGTVAFISLLIYSIAISKEQAKARRIALSSKLKEMNGYLPTKRLYTFNNESLISIDDKSEKLVITMLDKNKVFSFKEIIESEIIYDDVTVTKTSRSSQIGGAVVGGLVAGGVGAIIGGLSANTKSINKIKKVSLKLMVDSTVNPNHKITLFENPVELDKDDIRILPSLKDAEDWHSIFKVIINRNSSTA